MGVKHGEQCGTASTLVTKFDAHGHHM